MITLTLTFLLNLFFLHYHMRRWEEYQSDTTRNVNIILRGVDNCHARLTEIKNLVDKNHSR